MAGSNDAPSYWLQEFNSAALPMPATLPSDVEVVVIGGGIMGISTAYWLSRSGIRVLVLEAHRLAWGASGRNAGLMLAGSQPLEDPALVRAVLHEEDINAGYTQPGHLALASSEAIWNKICQEAARRQNTATPIYALDHSACEDLLSMRINNRFLGGRWFLHGGLIDPVRFVYGLAKATLRYRGSLVTHTQVLDVKAVAGRGWFDIHTTRGRLRARQVVFACQIGLSKFAPDFNKFITPIRGQVMSTQPLPRLFRIGLALDWGTVYWRQTLDGAIILGGYRNLDPQTETGDQARINPRIQSALSHFLSDTFPDFPPFHISQCWAGIMDYPVDGRPMIGPMPHLPGQWVIAGFGGHGLPVGLGAGKALTEAIVTGRTPALLEPFDPGRFTVD